MPAESFWTAVWWPVIAGLLLSFPIEALVRPGVAPPWRRPLSALAMHCGLWLTVFLFELAVFQRPWFATTVALAFLAILALVNNAKYHSLREPFIAQDFEYFLDTIRFPRLYLPFFGVGKAVLATIAVLSAIALGLYLEPPLTRSIPLAVFLNQIILFVVLTGALLTWSGMVRQPLTWDPIQDIHTLGFLGSILPYLLAERNRPQLAPPFQGLQPIKKRADSLPHLLVVQSESFFDPRLWSSAVRPDLLPSIDALKRAAAFHGHLQVPAWGANTVRTEFAFLSGLCPDHIGVHRFNPYRKLARWYPSTLAGLLRQMGYRTVCIHPYPAEFYGRKAIFPRFGFDQFIDLQSFSDQDKSGPYIGDVALANRICTEMAHSSEQPLFLFTITMENHGPLHWEQPFPGESDCYCTGSLPPGCEDLIIYLRHLENADRMAGMLAQSLQSLDQETWLCWYGDHVPILPGVYNTLGNPDGRTDYLIWSNRPRKADGRQVDQQVEDLGVLLLKEMELIAPDVHSPGAHPAQERFGIVQQNA